MNTFIDLTDVWMACWTRISRVEAMLERRVIYLYIDESHRHGAEGSRRSACNDGRTQGGGVVWRHGDVDGRDVEVYVDI
jgi:hypothetical protein